MGGLAHTPQLGDQILYHRMRFLSLVYLVDILGQLALYAALKVDLDDVFFVVGLYLTARAIKGDFALDDRLIPIADSLGPFEIVVIPFHVFCNYHGFLIEDRWLLLLFDGGAAHWQ